jgi:hypothetical protein
MGPLLPLAIRRSFAGRGMMGVMALGIVVAAMLLASAPIYARAMSDLGLRFFVKDELGARYAAWVEMGELPVATPDGLALRSAVQKQVDERTGWFAASQARGITLAKYMIENPAAADDRKVLGQPGSLTGYQDHVRVVSGKLPAKGGGPLEVAMGQKAAETAGLKLGDTFTLRDTIDTCVRKWQVDLDNPPPPCDPNTLLTFGFPATLVGIVAPTSERDAWWAGGATRLFERIEQPLPEPSIAPMFADESALLELATTKLPSYRATASWFVYADPEALDHANFERARADLTAMRTELESHLAFTTHPLGEVLDDWRGRRRRFRSCAVAAQA